VKEKTLGNLKQIVDETAAKSGYGGLDSSTMYGEFATEVALAYTVGLREALREALKMAEIAGLMPGEYPKRKAYISQLRSLYLRGEKDSGSSDPTSI